MAGRQATSFRLRPRTLALIDILRGRYAVSQAGMIAVAIQDKADQLGVTEQQIATRLREMGYVYEEESPLIDTDDLAGGNNEQE